MTLNEALTMMDELYTRLCTCNSTAGRRNNGEQMKQLMQEFPALNQYWETTNAFYWCDRFVKIEVEVNVTVETFEDGINYDAPKVQGLYFIGETHFNPFTHEEFYWVKIGRAVDIKKRMAQYNTHCPMLWRIDYCEDYENEGLYHLWLKRHCKAKCNHNEEWFLVNRETYLEMCEKGFSFFN